MAEENIIIGNVALLRRDRRRGLHPRRGRRALLRPQQRRQRGGRGRGRPRLRVHDRRPRGRPRADRAQLRGRHVGRRRLRARRGRRASPRSCNTEMVGARASSTIADEIDAGAGHDRAPRAAAPAASARSDDPRRAGTHVRAALRAGHARTTTGACSRRRRRCATAGLSQEEAEMAAFEQNAHGRRARRREVDRHGQADRIHGVRARAAAGPRAAGARRATGASSTTTCPRRRCSEQGARCMDCGVPFCHTGNAASTGMASRLPDQQPDPRVERSRLPRPVARGARSACTRPTTSPSSPAASARRPARARACSASTSRRSPSRSIECAIVDRGFDEGWVVAEPPPARTGKKVAVVGSGPAGLACAAAAQPGRPHASPSSSATTASAAC